MKKLSLVLLLVPLSVVAQSVFDGTWKTNMSEAKISQKPIVFAVDKGMYTCDSCVPKISIKADGQDQNVAAPARDYDMLAVKVADPNSVQFTAKKGSKPVFEQTRTASADGKTLTVASTNYNADGSAPFKSEAKLDRISKGPAGSNSISGSWRIANAQTDDPGTLSTYKSTSDGLSVSTPTGQSWEAKFDGKDYPVKGVFSNETVSLKKVNDHTIDATYKRDGKPYSVEKMTVSADGKQMTTAVDNKLSGRVSTFVAEKQ
jgi:hypothetical protein